MSLSGLDCAIDKMIIDATTIKILVMNPTKGLISSIHEMILILIPTRLKVSEVNPSIKSRNAMIDK